MPADGKEQKLPLPTEENEWPGACRLEDKEHLFSQGIPLNWPSLEFHPHNQLDFPQGTSVLTPPPGLIFSSRWSACKLIYFDLSHACVRTLNSDDLIKTTHEALMMLLCSLLLILHPIPCGTWSCLKKSKDDSSALEKTAGEGQAHVAFFHRWLFLVLSGPEFSSQELRMLTLSNRSSILLMRKIPALIWNCSRLEMY